MADTNVPPNVPPAPPPAPKPAAPGPVAILTASALLALYIGLTIAMIAYFSSEQAPRWEHALLIYNSFTAFAVAAGGVLLGTQIQQGQVVAARQQASDAKQETDRVKQAAREALAATHVPPPGAAAAAAAAADPMAQVRAKLSQVL